MYKNFFLEKPVVVNFGVIRKLPRIKPKKTVKMDDSALSLGGDELRSGFYVCIYSN